MHDTFVIVENVVMQCVEKIWQIRHVCSISVTKHNIYYRKRLRTVWRCIQSGGKPKQAIWPTRVHPRLPRLRGKCIGCSLQALKDLISLAITRFIVSQARGIILWIFNCFAEKCCCPNYCRYINRLRTTHENDFPNSNHNVLQFKLFICYFVTFGHCFQNNINDIISLTSLVFPVHISCRPFELVAIMLIHTSPSNLTLNRLNAK